MKKITSSLLFCFLVGISTISKAQCPAPGTMVLVANDTTTIYNTGETNSNTIGSPYSCNSTPFFIYTKKNGCGTSACIFAPCLTSYYNLYYTSFRNNVTETFYEPSGTAIGCLAPSNTCPGYFGQIGGAVPPISGFQAWLFQLYQINPAQSHSFSFCKTGGGALSPSNLSITDCWSNATLAGPQNNWSGAPACFTLTVAAGTNIGTGVMAITPTVSAAAFQDLGVGYSYVNPSLMNPGTYTVTYTFTAPGCPAVSANYIFTVSPPSAVTYNPNWTALSGLCTGNACSNLPPQVTGTPGGTWSGNVTGTQFCPGTTGAGNFPVTYSVGLTATCGNTQTHTLTVNATPTVTSVASPTTICQGQSAVLTGGGATTFTWSANAGGVISPTATVSPGVGSTTYTVTGTSNGCTNTSTVSVNVNALPVVTASANPVAICSGQTTTLTAGGATTYTWDANAGNATTSSVTVTPTANTTYTVTGNSLGCTATQTVAVNVTTTPTLAVSPGTTICNTQTTTISASGATTYTWLPGGMNTGTVSVNPSGTTIYTVTGANGNCTDVKTVTITVTPLPSLTITATPASICNGQSSVLTGSGATTYTWSANAGSVHTTTVSVSPGSTATYTLSGTQNGCSDSVTLSVTVNTQPNVTIAATSTNTCSGQSTTLTGGGATNYTWMPGGLTTNTISVSPGTTTTYTVTGANGTCSGTQTVTVNVTPTPTISISSVPSSTICAGQTTTLTASGGTTYTWTPGNLTTATVTVSPGNTTTYTVTGTSAGCSSPKIVVVTVNPLPTLNAVSGQTVCAGDNVLPINFVVNPGTATVGWTNSNVNIGLPANGIGNISGYTAPNVVTQQTGTITAAPADPITGCTGIQQSFLIIINPSPSLTGTPTLDSSKCGAANGGVTGVNVTGGTPTYTYQWYNGPVPIPGATQATLSNVIAGTYSVLITDAKGCHVAAAATTFTVPGSLPVAASFTPNPSTGPAPLNVTFTNMSSSTANTYNWTFGNGSSSTAINPSTIYGTGGTYTVVLTASNNGHCPATATVTIIVDQQIVVIIPNIFSPNGDNINEEFSIVSNGLTTLNCDIFNRWGQKVKTLVSPTDKWDGTLDNGNKATDGTYFYVLTATSYDGKQHNSQGSITLVR